MNVESEEVQKMLVGRRGEEVKLISFERLKQVACRPANSYMLIA